METAHGLGVESTATFMMGTGETNAERIEHLRMIRDVQDRTGGFRSFIPWTYQPENNHLKGRTQATSLEYLRMVAVARLFFDNVNHLQGSWLTTGKDIGQLTLHFGADDLGSVMLEENVVSSAGARHRSNRTELIELIRGAGRIPAQRDTLYRHLVVHADPARRSGRRPRPFPFQLDRVDPHCRQADPGAYRRILSRACRSRSPSRWASASSIVYGISIVVQHGAAHTGTGEEDPHGLFQLLRNRRWLLAIGGDFVGFVLQIAALSTGPVVLIQPLVVLMLPVALITGSFLGGPRPGPAEYLSMAAVLGGLSGFIGMVGRARHPQTPDPWAAGIAVGHDPRPRVRAVPSRAWARRQPARRGVRRGRRGLLRDARRAREHRLAPHRQRPGHLAAHASVRHRHAGRHPRARGDGHHADPDVVPGRRAGGDAAREPVHRPAGRGRPRRRAAAGEPAARAGLPRRLRRSVSA